MIAEAIACNEAIQIIRLFEVNILTKQGEFLKETMMANMSLKCLDLRYCGIGDNAMAELAKGIRESIHLTEVDMRHNHFEKQGLHDLINALKATMVCRKLKFECVYIDKEDADLLTTFLTDIDCSLEEIELHDNDMTFEVF